MIPLYVYAIVDARPRRALGLGHARRPVRAIAAGGAFAIVARALAPEPTPSALALHDRVVRRVMRACPAVLPVRFGSTAEGRDALGELFAPFAESLPTAFARVRGAVQFTLRVTGRARPAPRPPRGAGAGTRWLTARLERLRVPEIAEVLEATRPWVREQRVERHDRPPLVATVYHLVARADARAWRSAFERSASALRGVEVRATGPWPPYAFAELP